MGEFFRRLYHLINQRRFDAELENDMEFHREMAARAGNSNFGNSLRLREQAYESWGWTWLDRLMQDLRFGLRILSRSPGFTLVAVLVLAIGVGVNVSAFSLFNMVALKPLPVPEADRLVRLERRSPDQYSSEISFPSFLFYREHARTLSATMAVMGVPPMEIDNDQQLASASFVTPNYFVELGTRPADGRLLDPASDGSAKDAPAVVLSYGFWQRRFGGDPNVAGRVIHLNGKPVTIAGVTPFAFASLGGQDPDLWLPIAQQPYFIERSTVLHDWTNGSVRMWGKLAPGVSAGAAEQELRTLTNELRRQHPDAVWDKERIQSSPGGHLQVMQPQMVRVAAMIGTLALLILIVACANVGGLMAARAVTRQHEIGIRIAIGAGRWRIFRQLCTESLVLGSLGSLAGLGLSWAVLRIVLLKFDAPGWLSARPDWRVLLFAVAMTVVATLLFGLMPALQIARQRQQKTFARQILVGAQIAASSVLLIVAALLVHAAQHALYTDPGFGYEQIVSIDPGLSRHDYTPAGAGEYLDQMQSRLRALPGVRAVSLVQLPPLGHVVSNWTTEIRDRKVTIYPNWVTPEFFPTMGISLRLGRIFHPGEKHVVIVSESLARRQWPGEDPLGQTVGEGANRDSVIGVVADAHINALNDDDALEQYWAAQPENMPNMVIMVRSAGEPGSIGPAARAIATSLDRSVFPEVRQIKILYRENMRMIEDVAAIVSLVGLIAAALAAIGLIGLVAFVVTQRTKEIAIRIALGGRPGAVLSAVLLQFRWPLILGSATGTVLAAFGSGLLRIMLYGVSNLDPASFATALGLLGLIAVVSMLVPAIRALRLDLAAILHYE
ncbi:MAG TPA: ABC transporter permease [Acidobacteriaceae bacterium]|jgi:predicted permease|nr:ABC transporter permease [Acidobacteriaceae bacterium]